jgi:hypothetical protein
MALTNIDFGSAMRRLADKRIEDAIKEGKFDNLPGFGKPLNLEPLPADENARMTWWMLRIMRQHDFTPHEVVWRKTIERLKEEVSRTRDEAKLIKLVHQINQLVRKVNTMGTNALTEPVVGVSLEVELIRLAGRSS